MSYGQKLTLIGVVLLVPLGILLRLQYQAATKNLEYNQDEAIGVAYIVSILASLVVSLTVTPILCWWLLPNAKATSRRGDGWVVRGAKAAGEKVMLFSCRHPWRISGVVAGAAVSVQAPATKVDPNAGALPAWKWGSAYYGALVTRISQVMAGELAYLTPGLKQFGEFGPTIGLSSAGEQQHRGVGQLGQRALKLS